MPAPFPESRVPRLVALLVALLALAGGAERAGADGYPDGCSGAGHGGRLPAVGLPAPVARMRARIAAAAADCDYRRLQRLAGGAFHYDYTHPDQTHFAAFLREGEARGTALMLTLVEALRTACRVVTDDKGKALTYVWPGDGDSPGMKAFRERGGLGGWHLFIQPDGAWTAFEYGD